MDWWILTPNSHSLSLGLIVNSPAFIVIASLLADSLRDAITSRWVLSSFMANLLAAMYLEMVVYYTCVVVGEYMTDDCRVFV